ncbi:MAG TPA: MarR family transcriptional regulator [Gaiellaceae bacterium]|nr:MarR family transcriptional regulator [Gaiellaceae bacterium]
MPAPNDLSSAASELRIVLGQLMRRLRADGALPTSHLAVLSRLDRSGAQTTSGLAAAERMRPQSMAQTVAELEKEGLVERRADAADRRQILVELTHHGREFVLAERRKREDWLSKAIADELTPAEQQVLLQAIDLLHRLAEL